MINNILVVCMGNICRSPMAEALLRQQIHAKNLDVQVSSAGITALVGHAADASAQQILFNKHNLDISSHRARQLTQELCLNTDLILVMESTQQRQIEFNFPGTCGKVHRLGKWSGYDIADPYRRPIQAFEQALLLIEQCVNDWQTRLWK